MEAASDEFEHNGYAGTTTASAMNTLRLTSDCSVGNIVVKHPPFSRGCSYQHDWNICTNTQSNCVSSSLTTTLISFAVALRTNTMALNATAVEILIDKGKFEPEVALGIAEAIEVSMTESEFVTVPILDARLHELRADFRTSLLTLEHKMDAGFQDLKSEMDRRFAEMDRRFGEMGATMDRRLGEMGATMDRSLGEMDAKVDRSLGEMDAKVDRKFAELELKMERIKADLVRWVFLVMLGNVALTAGATAALNALNHLR